MSFVIKKADMVDALENALKRKPSDAEYHQFTEYLGNDIYEWLKENARCFVRGMNE